MSQLEDLLQDCTVRITIPGQGGWGTGFFVATGLILTCAHVVKRSPQQIQIEWQNESLNAVVELERSIPDPYDLALLRVTLATEGHPPCVWLDEEVRSRDPLYLFGYPDQDFPNGCPVAFHCEGLTGDEPALIKFALGQVRPGMSGSPLLNQRTGGVCGMVKFTRDRSSDLGGGAIPTRVILEQLPQLRELQQQFRQRDSRWIDCLCERTAEPSHTVHGDVVAGDKVGRDKIGVQINHITQVAGEQPSAASADIDFQPYLDSVASTYEKWWQYYTLTDAAGKQRQVEESAPLFDFGLTVQTVPKQAQEQEQEGKPKKEQEKVERFSVLDGLRKYALGEKPEPVLLVGRPGSGKSTALARLMLEEALTPSPSPRIGRGEPERIPVLVELRYWQGSIAELILNALKRHDLAVPPDQLETVLKQSLLLFDGVNELPSDQARTELIAFRRNHSQIPMIFTTRDLGLGGDLGIERKLEMLPLTEAQMQAFIRAYIPGRAEAMLRQLKGRLRELGQTPLLLWMLCSLFQQTQTIPQNLGEVFRAFTQRYERRLKQDVVVESDRRLWPELLKRLAARMMQGKKPTELRVAITPREIDEVFADYLQTADPLAPRKALDDLLKHHLLQRNGELVEFRHQLIQEYYAAEYLLRLLPTLTDDQLKRDYLNYLKWTEPIALMLALVEEKDQALRVVKLAMDDVDLLLGARLAGEVRASWQSQTVGWINAREIPNILKVDCWATSHSEAAIAGLLQALQDPHEYVRRRAAFALRNLGSADSITDLWQLHLRQPAPYLKDAIAAIQNRCQFYNPVLQR